MPPGFFPSCNRRHKTFTSVNLLLPRLLACLHLPQARRGFSLLCQKHGLLLVFHLLSLTRSRSFASVRGIPGPCPKWRRSSCFPGRPERRSTSSAPTATSGPSTVATKKTAPGSARTRAVTAQGTLLFTTTMRGAPCTRAPRESSTSSPARPCSGRLRTLRAGREKMKAAWLVVLAAVPKVPEIPALTESKKSPHRQSSPGCTSHPLGFRSFPPRGRRKTNLRHPVHFRRPYLKRNKMVSTSSDKRGLPLAFVR